MESINTGFQFYLLDTSSADYIWNDFMAPGLLNNSWLEVFTNFTQDHFSLIPIQRISSSDTYVKICFFSSMLDILMHTIWKDKMTIITCNIHLMRMDDSYNKCSKLNFFGHLHNSMRSCFLSKLSNRAFTVCFMLVNFVTLYELKRATKYFAFNSLLFSPSRIDRSKSHL